MTVTKSRILPFFSKTFQDFEKLESVYIGQKLTELETCQIADEKNLWKNLLQNIIFKFLVDCQQVWANS